MVYHLAVKMKKVKTICNSTVESNKHKPNVQKKEKTNSVFFLYKEQM